MDPAPVELVIFDCDGVLVDSERIAIQVDIEVLAELGWELTVDEVVEHFVGRSDEDMTRAIEAHLGVTLPVSWDAQFAPRYHEAMAALTVVDGVPAVLDQVEASGLTTCVASNGSHDKIERSLTLTGLRARFGDRVFSVDDVTRAKPEPDLFLHAASVLGVAPASCAVVEDSRYGVAAARAAGMQVFGYGGGVTPAAWLEGPGTTVFHHMRELPDLLGAALHVASTAMDDLKAMSVAIEEARAALAHGDVPIGAVVLVDGEIVARRHNERELTHDPSAHAEILALRDASAAIGSWRLDAATLVVTLEPCAMCAGAAVNGRVGRVVFGARDLKAGAVVSLYGIGSDPRLNHEFEVTADVAAGECGELLTTFFADLR